MNTRLMSICLLCGCVVGVAGADVVTLTDGSKLLGSVERMEDGQLVLHTEFAGTLEIDASMIATVQTDEPVNVGMDTGDRLVGPIEWKPEIEAGVVQTAMGGIPVKLERVSAIWPQDGESPEVRAMQEQIAKVEAEAEAARARWELTAELGLLYTEGNSDTMDFRGRIEARRVAPRDLLKLYVSGEYSEENDERSAHEVKGGAYYEHLFTKRFFGYGRIDLEYDEFEDLDLRVSNALGVGYYFIKEEAHEFKGRGGIGYLHETYNDGRVEDRMEAELGIDYRLDIKEWMRFTHSTTWFPTFDGLDDYRLVSDSGLIFPLGDSDVWKIKLGALYEYDSKPNPGRERLDQTYYANLMLDVK